MSGWGQNDSAVTANSTTTIETTIGAPTQVYDWVAKGSGRGTNPVSMDSNSAFGNTSPGSGANVDYNLYGNTTVGAFINNMAIGIFGVNAVMMGTNTGGLSLGRVILPGSGYASNAAVTITPNGGGTGASGNTTVAVGRVTVLTVNAAGSGFTVEPNVTIAPPAAININANTTSFEPTGTAQSFNANTLGVVSNTFIIITSANTYFPTVGQKVLYTVPTGNSALAPLANSTYYWIAFSNSTAVSLAQSQAAAYANTPVNTLNPTTSAFTNQLANTADVILISTANSLFLTGDQLTYGVPTGNTPVAPLTGNTTYYVTFSNTTALAISATSGGSNISFFPTSPNTTSTQVHTLTGQTATGIYDIADVYPEVTSAGWIVRREGTGGRAGRVQYETLVAISTIGINGTTSTGKYGTASVISSNASVDSLL